LATPPIPVVGGGQNHYQAGNQILGGNHQLYNVLITAHTFEQPLRDRGCHKPRSPSVPHLVVAKHMTGCVLA